MVMSAKQRPTSEADAQVGQAWSMHHQGKNEDALQLFREIVQRWPEHIDANYGLALTMKATGNVDEARNAFNRAKTLVQAAETATSDNDARMLMLSRLIDQQLAML